MLKLELALKEDADAVLEAMHGVVRRYGYVTYADCLDLVGINPVYSDEKIRWTDLKDVSIESDNGVFVLNLPSTE
jgi:hypothetical protein